MITSKSQHRKTTSTKTKNKIHSISKPGPETYLEKDSAVKREVKKELTKIKKQLKAKVKCIICFDNDAKYQIKGSSNSYCKNCAQELFESLDHLQRI